MVAGICFDNARILKEAGLPGSRAQYDEDGFPRAGYLSNGLSLYTFGDEIQGIHREREIQSNAMKVPPECTGFERVDCRGMTLMPGLIDSHVHVTASSANLRMPSTMPPSLLYARSVPILSGMLDRGFTTVRDCGGADHGLATAVEEGSIRGPRIVHCGKALSQTGGHGDFRGAGDVALASGACSCCNFTIGRVCDGADACRAAVRDEVRKGAKHIKIMASGGVSSPTDRLENLQFSEEELKCIVEEARNAGIYACAHAYTDEAIRRAIRCGVACIEHGNYASRNTLKEMRANGTYLVPTLVTYERLKIDGVANGMSQAMVDKVADLVEAGQKTLKAATEEGVMVCYGSDLLGDMHKYQAHSIKLHLDAGVSAARVLNSLTGTPGRLLGKPWSWMRAMKNINAKPHVSKEKSHLQQLRIGRLSPGFKADVILVDGDVANDPTVLMDENNIKLVVKDGVIVKNILDKKDDDDDRRKRVKRET